MSTESSYLFTSESVTEGHPDKIADQISDAVLDAALAEDPTARVACETLVTTVKLVREHFSMTPKGIIEELNLRRPIYKATAAFGHFGRSGNGFTWERTDKAESLRAAAGV